MNSLRKRLLTGLAATCAAASAAGAFAQMPGADHPDGPGRGDHAQMFERMKERMAKLETQLHDKLKLNASQENAWKTYIGKMKPVAPPAHADRAEMEGLSAPQRMEKMLARMKEHEQQMESRLAATKDFYAQLSPEQQKVFDQETARGWGAHHGPHGGERKAPAK